VQEVVSDFRNALQPDEIVLGGGNARRLKHLPPNTRLGDDLAAFRGGLRFWDDKSRSGGKSNGRRNATARTSG
jgi:polyphosphate glucokinase